MVATTESPRTTSPPPAGPLYAACGFPPRPESVPACRRWLNARLAELHVDADGADLCASELATNAIKHGRGPFEIRCCQPLGGTVCVEVRDWVSQAPLLRDARDEDENGRGLELVDALAAYWGFERLPEGKRVFAYVTVTAA